ncbi:MAG: hypothetical protein M3Y65_14240 [Pseudomonadota bacterium]|nr:hypothetical protein [Pseudomonadota bacterium]
MNDQRYWFPVRPARHGWGWGLPVAWQGWVAYLLFFVALIAGIVLLAAHGQLAVIGFSGIWAALFLGLMFWKGEPQKMRDNSSP